MLLFFITAQTPLSRQAVTHTPGSVPSSLRGSQVTTPASLPYTAGLHTPSLTPGLTPNSGSLSSKGTDWSVSIAAVWDAPFFPRVTLLCLYREPQPKKTQKAPHHRPKPHQLKAPSPKIQNKTPTPKPQTPNHHN